MRQVSTHYWMGDHCETGQNTILDERLLIDRSVHSTGQEIIGRSL